MKRGMLLLLLTLCLPAVAGEHGGKVGGYEWPPKAEKVKYNGVGVVGRVEPIIGLVRISYDEMPEFGWNASVSDFRVRPRDLLKGIESGMRVRFQLTAVDSLHKVITAIEPIK